MVSNKCIILDLDETLVHTREDIQELYSLDVMNNKNLIPYRQSIYNFCLYDLDGKRGSSETCMWGTKRPHVDSFISFCFANFSKVCVWTAGTADYAEEIVNALFKSNYRMPDVVWSRNDCQSGGGILFKPITKMAASYPFITLENSIIIDDRRTTFRANVENGILIPPYQPLTIGESFSDDKLPYLMKWISESGVLTTNDVRTIPKTGIFPYF